MNNILQLTKNNPYPPTSGSEMRTWRTTEQFAELGTVWLACPWGDDTLPPGNVNVRPINSPVLTWKPVQNDLWYGGFLLDHHPLMALLTDRIVAAHPSDVEFDVVVSESPQLIDAARKIAGEHSATLLLNKHNAYYQFFDQYLENIPLPAVLRRRAVRNLRQYEQRGIDSADIVVFQSAADREAFDTLSGVVTAVIPNGTDVERVRSHGDPAGLAAELGIDRQKPVCLFLGSFDYDPNHAAAQVIIDELAPELSDVEFLLAGRNPPPTTIDNVYAPGFVDDLADAFGLADIALCPLPRGSGTKLKMLDYLAAGLPIVATTVGTQGLPIKDGVHALVRNDSAGMVKAIRTLVATLDDRDELAGNARRLGERYDWAELMQGYEPLLAQKGVTASHHTAT